MNKELFTTQSPGQLLRVQINTEHDWAYIPDPLPNSWTPNNEIWELLVKAREELARLDGIGRHMPDYRLLLKPLQQREALKSSSLEGTYATPEQLLLFEVEPKTPHSVNDPSNTWKEVYNYNRALELGQSLLNDIPFSNRLIKELHRCLLQGVRGNQGNPGQFRDIQVQIGSDKRFIPPPAIQAIQCINGLEKFLNEPNEIDPLIYCFMVHYQFETIHPFRDGNGRVGRLLLSLMIYKMCNLICPWLYLSAFFDTYKSEYIGNLFNISVKHDWHSWIAFCLRGTIHQATDSISRFDKLVQLKEKYLHMISTRHANIRLHSIIDKLLSSPIITIPQACKMSGVSYPTAKSDIDILINLSILKNSTLTQSPKTYFAPEIMDIAYGD